MKLNLGTLIGQLTGLCLIAIMIYLVALIPIVLRRIAKELTKIRDELRKRRGLGQLIACAGSVAAQFDIRIGRA